MMKYLKFLFVPTPLILFLLALGSFPHALQVGDPSYIAKPYAWASKPACNTGATNTQILVTDVGPVDWIATCDGTRWNPTGPITLCQLESDITGSVADTNEHRFTGSTCTVPAGLPTAASSFQIISQWATVDGDTASDNSVFRVRMHTADDDTGGTVFHTYTVTNASLVQTFYTIRMNGTTSSQQGYIGTAVSVGFGASAGGSAVTASIDTTSTSYIKFSSQLADNANDTMTLHGATVIYVP